MNKHTFRRAIYSLVPVLGRRKLLKNTVGFSVGLVAASSLPKIGHTSSATQAAQPKIPPSHTNAPQQLAQNERHWSRIANLYKVNSEITNLENGYYGIMSEPVREEYQKNIDFLNQYNSFYLRTNYDNGGLNTIREKIALVAGVAPQEIAITRGATEALQNLIVNYNKLRPGDTVMYADLDYDSMQYAMNFLKERRGVNVVKINLPEPATKQGVLDTYVSAIAANPGTKLLLLTHLSHRTGLVIPVPEIADMARANDIDVIVDAAHSWGQLDFTVPDLQVDFAGFNLHKWIGAPLGVGFLYIRKERLQDIDPHYADEDYPKDDIRSRVHTGTTNTANVMTVPKALEFHTTIGVANKQARLRYLRDYWVSRVRDFKDIQILTPDSPESYGALTSFRLVGKVSREENVAIVNQLRDEYKILTVRRGGVATGNCVRVTPSLYNSPADLDRLVIALKEITES